MDLNSYPNLLMKKRLVRPIVLSIDKIQNAREHIKINLPDILMHGIFVMIVSSMEIMLSDSLKYFLRYFPQKLDGKDLKYSKDEFFNNYFRLIDATAEKCVITQSYKSFDDYFKYYASNSR